MYLITLDKVTNTDIIGNLNQLITDFHLSNQLYIKYVIPAESVELDKIPFHFIELNTDDFTGIDEYDIEDLILDIAETQKQLILKVGKNVTTYNLIKDILESFKVRYVLDKELNIGNYTPDLKNLSDNDTQIIFDIFNEPNNRYRFTLLDFLIRLTITNNNILNSDRNIISGTSKEDIFNIMFIKPDESYNKYCTLSNDFVLGTYLYNPLYFTGDSKNIIENIKEYKTRLFNLIKNISPEVYPYLPQQLVELLNHNGYIQEKDYLPIIQGNDAFLEFYK